MKITTFALIAMAMSAATIGLTATAQADPDYQFFQSPSGDIQCEVTYGKNANPFAFCTVQHSTYAVPPEQNDCESAVGLIRPQFVLIHGDSPGNLSCVVGSRDAPTWPTLDYGQKTRSFGAITCNSEQSGVTCTDSSTGHFFRVSRESYELG